MRNAPSVRRRPFFLLWTIPASLILLALIGASVAGLDAQPAEPSRKPPKEEKEEEPAKPDSANKTVTEPVPTRSPVRDEMARLLPADLGQLAQQATQPDVKDLYTKLTVPSDYIVLYGNSRQREVEPIGPYIDTQRTTDRKSVSVQPLPDSEGNARESFEIKPKAVQRIEYYEGRALRQVNQFLKLKLDLAPAGSRGHLSRRAMLQVAEKALSAVSNFYREARAGGKQRVGTGWDDLEKALRDRLLEVRLEQVADLEKSKNWLDAEILAERLWQEAAADSPERDKARLTLVPLRVRHAEQALQEDQPKEAARLLKRIDEQFPNSSESQGLRKQLEDLALNLREKAKTTTDKGKAMDLLDSAERIYPRLEGLQDMKAKLRGDYPILTVAVRQLPQSFTPAQALTTVEKQILPLLYESLIVARTESGRGVTYQPQLAQGPIAVVPLGRQFELVHDAYWSDGQGQLTANDVRMTIDHLKSQRGPGLAAGWDELIDGADVLGDPFRVRLTLQQGYIDPLGLMSFPILPGAHRQLDESFARKPVGTGPYKLKESADNGRVELIANPHYRGGKIVPRIREIHFVKTAQPVADFLKHGVDMVLDLPAGASQPPAASVQTLSSRRVNFLAVNHRPSDRRDLDLDLDLRLALAHAIDREKILQERFRTGTLSPTRPLHRILNGPYPAGSWACATDVPADLYNPNYAKGLVSKIKQSRESKLTLKFPNDDDRVRQACADISRIWEDLTHTALELQPRSPYDLFQEVVVTHEYDLAYMSWDYASEAYWLWPLFDPRATAAGGSNYLGYQNDADLEGYFQKARSRREFAEVQKWTHDIHRRLVHQMPLIPLWQLDVQIAVQPELKDRAGRPLRLEGRDALAVFHGIEDWQLEGGAGPRAP